MATGAHSCSINGCLKPAVDSLTCSNCFSTYCSNAHRKADRKAHKIACKSFLKSVAAAKQADIQLTEGLSAAGKPLQKIAVKGPVSGGAIYDTPEHLEFTDVTFSESTGGKVTFLRASTITLIGQIIISGDNPDCGLFIQADRLLIDSPVTITCPGSITLTLGRLILQSGLEINCKTREDGKMDLNLRKSITIDVPEGKAGERLLKTQAMEAILAASMDLSTKYFQEKMKLASL